MPEEYSMLIGGKKVKATTGEVSEVINPANGQVVGMVPKCGEADVDAAVRAALEA
ncbi:MAG TPA: aldehyde dehydrogenase, partial [Syntrophorhabdus aromaticivorans]|nr:aldehyde dehydrogenase [Syntrophorhabdus aromaticivorans]